MSKEKLDKIVCDYAVEITKNCPIYFCHANYECKYQLPLWQFRQEKYCLKRIDELMKKQADKDAMWVKGE